MSTEDRSPPGFAGAPFSATIAPDGHVTVVRLHGELDMATEPKVGRVVDEVLESRYEVVQLDLSDVTFCDARGIAALLAAEQRLATARRRLMVTGARPAVRRLLVATGLDGRLRTR